jgi:4-hydroxybenzoate polyprenyltransferase
MSRRPPVLPDVRDLTPAARVRWLARAARIVHPFPTALNVVAVAGLALVATGGTPEAGLLARMLATMLLIQCAIGVTNDYFDRELDAAAKPWKPIPAGLVTVDAARALAVALIAGAALLALTLGVAGFYLAMLGLAAGLAYDAGLKRTALSAVPYMVAIPTLPLWVWATLGEWQAELWWLLPLGALIGVSLHLANTAPDIEADRAHGVAGLAHRLGFTGSVALGWGSFAAALALSAALVPVIDYDLRWYLPAAATGLACLVAGVMLHRARPESTAGFALNAVAAVLVAVGWLAAVT